MKKAFKEKLYIYSRILLSLVLLTFSLTEGYADTARVCDDTLKANPERLSKFRIFSRSYGFLLGLQAGRLTFLEMGIESHWRKIAIKKPRLWGVSANVEYNLGYNTLGYKTTLFHKVGRINFTYGVNLNYYTDFEQGKFGLGPVIGFKLFGFHLLNGYNFMFGPKGFDKYNTLYVAVRYFFPLRSKVKIDK